MIVRNVDPRSTPVSSAEPMGGEPNLAADGAAVHAPERVEPSGLTEPLMSFHTAEWLARSASRLTDGTTLEHPGWAEVQPSSPDADTARPWRAATLIGRIVPWTPAVLLPLAITLWASALPAIDLSRMNDYGLVSVLPARVWAGFAVLMVSFVVCWWRADRARLLLTVHILVLIVMFYGIPSIVADSPRGPIVYRHAGITDYLTRTGLVDTRQDAYFSWPAFFMF